MITLTTLSNGFRIVTDPMPGLQSATVGVWVGAGARHETAGQTGIAHFLEHMAFKGTARRSARQIAEAIEDLGGYINDNYIAVSSALNLSPEDIVRLARNSFVSAFLDDREKQAKLDSIDRHIENFSR